jgi:hypothetical protein
MPRRSTLVPATPGFSAAFRNIAIYRLGVRSAAFHEDDHLWMRLDGHDQDADTLPAVGSPLAAMLSADLVAELQDDIDRSHRGEIPVLLECETVEALTVVECIHEARRTQSGTVYEVVHLFVAPAGLRHTGGAR